MNSPSVSQHRYPHQNEPAWSRSEKAIARKAFDAALERELQEVIREAKQKAGQIKEPADLWDLEHYLTQRHKEIDRKYEYRYSQLDLVFGRLKSASMRKIFRAWERISCEPSVLTQSSSLERTPHDLVLSEIAAYNNSFFSTGFRVLERNNAEWSIRWLHHRQSRSEANAESAAGLYRSYKSRDLPSPGDPTDVLELARSVEECPNDRIAVEEHDHLSYIIHLSNEPEAIWLRSVRTRRSL